MSRIQSFLQAIPGLLSSTVSIFIYLFLFFYLVLWAMIAKVVPALSGLSPSNDAQLILGNYTNVLSALGASIAAGTGVHVHKSVQRLHDRHDALQKSIEQLHAKVDALGGGGTTGGAGVNGAGGDGQEPPA